MIEENSNPFPEFETKLAYLTIKKQGSNSNKQSEENNFGLPHKK